MIKKILLFFTYLMITSLNMQARQYILAVPEVTVTNEQENQELGKAITAYLYKYLLTNDKIIIVPKDRFTSILNSLDITDFQNISNENLLRIRNILLLDFIIVSSFSTIVDSFILNITLINALTGLPERAHPIIIEDPANIERVLYSEVQFLLNEILAVENFNTIREIAGIRDSLKTAENPRGSEYLLLSLSGAYTNYLNDQLNEYFKPAVHLNLSGEYSLINSRDYILPLTAELLFYLHNGASPVYNFYFTGLGVGSGIGLNMTSALSLFLKISGGAMLTIRDVLIDHPDVRDAIVTNPYLAGSLTFRYLFFEPWTVALNLSILSLFYPEIRTEFLIGLTAGYKINLN